MFARLLLAMCTLGTIAYSALPVTAPTGGVCGMSIYWLPDPLRYFLVCTGDCVGGCKVEVLGTDRECSCHGTSPCAAVFHTATLLWDCDNKNLCPEEPDACWKPTEAPPPGTQVPLCFCTNWP